MASYLKALVRGIVYGIFVGYVVALSISTFSGLAQFRPTKQAFVDRFPTPLDALLYSTVIWAALGVMFALTGRAILGNPAKRTLRRRLLHAGVTAVLFTTLALCGGFAPLSARSAIRFLIEYLALYLVLQIVKAAVQRLRARPAMRRSVEGGAQ